MPGPPNRKTVATSPVAPPPGIVTERDLIAHVLSKGLDAQDVRVFDVCSTVEEITEI